ncbi:hypothetical protein LCGC14_1427290 [marine sediment metagenome]|uniref:Uncharacterized protein n=1 Tax=marine sediment metagenome TaxID=412755 RepID=A0A0F9M560_9ZZZZ
MLGIDALGLILIFDDSYSLLSNPRMKGLFLLIIESFLTEEVYFLLYI